MDEETERELKKLGLAVIGAVFFIHAMIVGASYVPWLHRRLDHLFGN